MNLGGPGWIDDVFEISVDIESNTLSTWDGLYGDGPVVKVIQEGGNVRGTITIKAPEGHSVGHWGVKAHLELKGSVDMHMNSIDIETEPVTLLEPGYLKDVTTIPFDFPLGDCGKAESYDGAHISVRHGVYVEIIRSWWTWNVEKNQIFTVQHLRPAPAVSADEPCCLSVKDCGAEVSFTWPSSHLNLDSELKGEVSVRQVVPGKQLKSVSLMLYKNEYGDEEEFETVIANMPLYMPLGSKPSDAAQGAQAAASAAAKVDVELQPAEEGGVVEETKADQISLVELSSCEYGESLVSDKQLAVQISLDRPEWRLHNTLPQKLFADNEALDKFGVDYFLRLIVQDSNGESFWNTADIKIHRPRLYVYVSPEYEEELLAASKAVSEV